MGERFTVYRSSAGSGKTHTLVKEYLRLALSEPRNPARFAKILAITFTNKAAGEMKERVMQNLFTLQVPPTHADFKQDYLDEMSAFCNLPAQEIQLMAGRVFKTMLHNYHLLKITTIDKFTVSLVYSFARDLNIDADHEIVTDKDEVIEAGVHALIEQSGKDAELTSIFLNFLGKGIEEGDRFNIKKELKNFCSKVLDEKGYTALAVASEYSEKDFLKAHAIASEKIKAIEQKVKSHTTAILDLLQKNNIEAADFYFKGIGNYSWIRKVDKEGFEEVQEAARVRDFIEGKRWQKDASPEKKAAFAAVEDEIVKHLEALLAFKKKERSSFLIHETVRNHTFSMALFKRLQEAIEQYKTSNSIILLSEFTKLVSDIVADEPAPFIYERLGERVKNIFVDEFQDTSSLQFGNLIPLMENSLATGDFVMMVGDAKQSIYRWRNGNVEQFIDLPQLPKAATEHHPFRQKVFRNESIEKTLPKNYRSFQKVVELNNVFFEKLLGTEEFSAATIQTAYKDVKQESTERKPGGYVEFKVNYERKSNQVDSNENTGAEKEIAATVQWIHQAIENGYTYGDIAILVRQHKDGEKIFNGLRQHQIPVVSNQAMSLSGSDELKTINGLFACLHELSSVTRIRQFAFFLAKTRKILEQHEQLISNLFGATGEVLLGQVFRSMNVKFNTEFFYSLNLYEQVYYIIHRLGFSKENAFVSAYLELVFEFFRKHGSNAIHFIRWWENNADHFKLQTGTGADSVQIVTIHKSKGLQYPIVILPFVNWTIRQTDKYFWLYEVPGYNISPLPVPLSKRLNDSDWRSEHEQETTRSAFDVINLLYVAMTRAEEQLFCYIDASSHQGLGKQMAYVLNTLSGNEKTAFYAAGEPVVRGKKKEVSLPVNENIQEAEPGKFLSWHSKLMVTAHFYQQYSDESPAQRRGILVHEIFAGIGQASEIDLQMEKYRQLGVLTGTEPEEVKADLEHLFGSKEFVQLAQEARQLSEAELFDGENKVYRPDRLFLYPQQPGDLATIGLLDLKTGDEEEKHLLQVRNYSRILQRAGYDSVDAWIYYVKTKKWIKLN